MNWDENSNTGNSSGSVSSRDSYKVDQITSAEAKGTDNIDISMVSEETTIVLSNDNLVKAHLVGSSSKKIKLTLVEEKAGNEIKIFVKRTPELDLNSEMFNHLKIEVSVPKNYNSNLKIKTVSGDIKLPEMKVQNVSLETVSGDIASSASIDNLTLNSVSGDATINNLVGSLKTHSISGKVNASFSTLNNSSIVGDSVSGSMSLSLPSTAKPDVTFTSVSGDLENDLGSSPDSSNKVNFHSVSGDLTINSDKS